MEGFRRHRDRIRFLLVHHEEAAAFMATGHAKSTGRLGVCLATSGPDGLNLINGLYDAKLDHAPVIAIPASIPTIVDIAVRTSMSRRTVSHITFPVDMQEADPDLSPWEGGLGNARTPATAPTYNQPIVVPHEEDVRRAADVLNDGSKVVILAGAGAIGASEEVLSIGGRILWEQMVLGYPEYGVRFQKHADFAPWASACGGYGRTVERPGELEAAVKETLAHDGPALLDVRVNPDEPPMPPKVRYERARGFVESFPKGQPRRMSIASTIFRDKLDQLRS